MLEDRGVEMSDGALAGLAANVWPMVDTLDQQAVQLIQDSSYTIFWVYYQTALDVILAK